MTPTCPPNYKCTFTPDPPPYDGPWWETSWGIAVAGAIIVAVVIVLVVMIVHLHKNAEDKRHLVNAREKRREKVDLSEQFTMQLDMAKGDPELLAFVKRQQSRLE